MHSTVRISDLAARSVSAMAVSLLLAAAEITPALAARTRSADPAAATFTTIGHLQGVAAPSARDAWAIGYTTQTQAFQTLIVHWNGTTWNRVPSPNPGGGAILNAVTATSASNAWAAGQTGTAQALILRWNGSSWKRAPAPAPEGTLSGIAATSATDAWAVGSSASGTLILH
jgi:hypothetical protein